VTSKEQDSGTISEAQLVERLKKGQEWAFNILVQRYQARLMKIAYGITLDREDSLEIVQDVFVNVFTHIKDFRQEAGLATWLRKITVNQCLNWKRKWKRRFRWHHDPIEDDQDKALYRKAEQQETPESGIREKQFELMLKKAIGNLPEKTRAVFVLNAFEGLSYEQIATTLNIKKGTVSSRLHWARKHLIRELDMDR